MATIDERVTTLEHSFADFQKEVGKSIRELNENGTIMLGLLQTILEEGQRRDLTLALHNARMSQVEAKVDAHTAILNAHTAKLSEHTAILNEHTARFDHVDATLAEILARLPEKA